MPSNHSPRAEGKLQRVLIISRSRQLVTKTTGFTVFSSSARSSVVQRWAFVSGRITLPWELGGFGSRENHGTGTSSRTSGFLHLYAVALTGTPDTEHTIHFRLYFNSNCSMRLPVVHSARCMHVEDSFASLGSLGLVILDRVCFFLPQMSGHLLF